MPKRPNPSLSVASVTPEILGAALVGLTRRGSPEAPPSAETVADLHAAAERLVRFAHTGEGEPLEALETVLAALRSVAGLGGSVAGDLADLEEQVDVRTPLNQALAAVHGEELARRGETISAASLARTPLGLVFAAAQGRIRVAKGEAVGAKHLAALSGMTARAIQRSTALAPDKTRRPWAYPAETARAWLRARGVPGFGIREPVKPAEE